MNPHTTHMPHSAASSEAPEDTALHGSALVGGLGSPLHIGPGLMGVGVSAVQVLEGKA